MTPLRPCLLEVAAESEAGPKAGRRPRVDCFSSGRSIVADRGGPTTLAVARTLAGRTAAGRTLGRTLAGRIPAGCTLPGRIACCSPACIGHSAPTLSASSTERETTDLVVAAGRGRDGAHLLAPELSPSVVSPKGDEQDQDRHDGCDAAQHFFGGSREDRRTDGDTDADTCARREVAVAAIVPVVLPSCAS